MRLKVDSRENGIHPNEIVVSIKTKDGAQRLVVHKRSLDDYGLKVGYPIIEHNEYYLVELPRETMSGLWRVWIAKSNLCEEREVA